MNPLELQLSALQVGIPIMLDRLYERRSAADCLGPLREVYDILHICELLDGYRLPPLPK